MNDLHICALSITGNTLDVLKKNVINMYYSLVLGLDISLLSKASNRATLRTKISAMTFSIVDLTFLTMIKDKLKHTDQLWLFLKKYINASTSNNKLVLVQMDTFMKKHTADNPFLKTANLREVVFHQLYYTVKKSCKKRGGGNIIEQLEVMKEYNRIRTCKSLWNWLIITIFFPPLFIITMIRLVVSGCF